MLFGFGFGFLFRQNIFMTFDAVTSQNPTLLLVERKQYVEAGYFSFQVGTICKMSTK